MATKQTKSKSAAKPQRTAHEIVADIDAARAKLRDANAELMAFSYPESVRIPVPTPPAPAPAAPPQLTAEQRQQAENERHERQYRDIMAEVAGRLHEIDTEWTARPLLAVLDILRDENGCTSPTEEFLLDLLREYSHRAVTPEYVDSQMEEYRTNFNEAVETARFFTAKYAEALKPATAAA
jgi:hypothetical protein